KYQDVRTALLLADHRHHRGEQIADVQVSGRGEAGEVRRTGRRRGKGCGHGITPGIVAAPVSTTDERRPPAREAAVGTCRTSAKGVGRLAAPPCRRTAG